MARRSTRNTESNQSNQSTEDTSTTTSNTENTEESTVTTTENENAQPDAEATENTESTETAAEKPEPDLTEFKSVVAEVVATADTTTGEVPEAGFDKVKTAYRALDRDGKKAAKAFVNDQMRDLMNGGDLPGAVAHMQINDNGLVAGGSKAKAEKVPTDPTEAYVQRVSTLLLAYQLATSNVPEGVNDDWEEKAQAAANESFGPANELLSWSTSTDEDKGDAPEASSLATNAVKLALGKSAKAGSKSTGGRSNFDGPRRNVEVHILNAFADKEVGTFMKIAEIVKTPSDEYAGDEPSAGAVSQRLFPKDKDGNPKESSLVAHGIVPDTDDKGNKGGRKVS